MPRMVTSVGYGAAQTPIGVQPPPTTGPWTFGAKTVTPHSSAATNTSLTLPTNSAGDVLFLMFLTEDLTNANDAGTPTLPAGWNIINSANLVGKFTSDSHVTAAYKISNGAEGPSISVSWGISQPFDSLIQTITPPAGKTAVFDAFTSNTSPDWETSWGSPVLGGLATISDLLLVVWADAGGAGTYTIDPLLTTVYVENQGNSNAGDISVGTINPLSTTAAISYTITSSLIVYRSLSIAFKAV